MPISSSELAPKLLAARSTKLTLIGVCVLTLVLGAWLAPASAPTPLSTPQERAAPLLEEQVQARDVRPLFADAHDIGARVRHLVLAIQAPPTLVPKTYADYGDGGQDSRPAGFAILVSDTLALTHIAALSNRTQLPLATADGLSIDATVAGFDPGTGIVLLQIARSLQLTSGASASAPAPGSMGVAVGQWNRRERMTPVVIGATSRERLDLTGAMGPLAPGTPIFDLNGALIGVTAVEAGDTYAVPITTAIELATRKTSTRAQPGAIGLGYQQLDGGLARSFGSEGVLINHVVAGGPAAIAGVIPGDVLMAVGKATVQSPETAHRTLRDLVSGNSTTLDLRRGGRSVAVDVTPVSTYDVAVLARRMMPRASATEAHLLFTPEELARAAIPPDARVLQVNGRAPSARREVEREIRTARAPVRILVETGDGAFFRTLEPGR